MKTFACPYCGSKYNRPQLIKHLDKCHDDELPPHYTAYRMAYDVVNDKHGHGNCVVCGKETKWNEKRQKYERLCGDPECEKEIRKTYESRMLKVYNKTTLLDDPEFQEKMLANRKIAGKYTWSDKSHTFNYMGQYEKNLFEFLDKTLEYKSNEVIAPGPVFEYTFNGKTHHWITDFLLLPYNLVIEVKDGGDNPNKRNMPEYRAKQIAKEKMITDKGTFSYLRLTNNNFGQLLSILAELKKSTNDEDKDPLFRIHESMETLDLYTDMLLKEVTHYFQYYEDDIDVIVEDLGSYIYNDPRDELTMHTCLVRPEFINKFNENHFIRHVGNLDMLVEHTFGDDATRCWVDENNKMEGYILGLKTSD